jgi:hypothetical protein
VVGATFLNSPMEELSLFKWASQNIRSGSGKEEMYPLVHHIIRNLKLLGGILVHKSYLREI